MTDLTTNRLSAKAAATAIVVIILIAAVGAYIYLTKPSWQTWNVTANVEKKHLIVSTTTSLYETGFLNILKTEFERSYLEIDVSFISQGTGLAIQTAMRGDADMILVHDPQRELKFMQDGYGVNRKIVAYNFFIIVGPEDDPAKIKGLSSLEAMRQIQRNGEQGNSAWLSRGDDSGTHAREKSLWKTAGYNVTLLRNEVWYFEAGAGMTTTLKMADEKLAYTLTDLGSYLMNYNNGNIHLSILVEGGYDLLNVYSAIACDPRSEYTNKANFEASMKFLEFIASDEGQTLFDRFGKGTYGEALFKPAVKLLKSSGESEVVQWIKKLAMGSFGGSECPLEYRYQEDDLYLMMKPAMVVEVKSRPEYRMITTLK